MRDDDEKKTVSTPRLAAPALAAAIAAARAAGVDRDPRALVRWAHALLGDQLMMTTSFQKSGMVILDMVREVAPGLAVYFLDTGLHFPETLAFAERIRRDWGVDVILHRPAVTGDAFAARYGRLWERDPDRCCRLNKVEPQRELLARHQGWIAGIRRDQTVARAGAEPLELLADGLLKIQPLALWSRRDVERYLAAHDVPVHPLFAAGYASIGCAPCTQPCSDPSDDRAGRWAGRAKTECGLHTMFARAAAARSDEPRPADS